MIVADQKPIEDIKEMLRGKKKVLAVGCGTCVTVCFAGGKREVGVLSSALRMATKLDDEPVQIDETVVQRQCEKEFIEHLGEQLDEYDAILSLGCGVGVQTLANLYPNTRVLPALNTKFMGGPSEQGVWVELCQGCGNCMLEYTGGIFLISLCAKQLMNGPCGGTDKDGRCEVDPDTPCAWFNIWERMDQLGIQDELMQIQPAKDWSSSRDGGRRRIVRKDLQKPELDEDI